MTIEEIRKAQSEGGKIGGASRSAKKLEAVRKNGKLGGRPRPTPKRTQSIRSAKWPNCSEPVAFANGAADRLSDFFCRGRN